MMIKRINQGLLLFFFILLPVLSQSQNDTSKTSAVSQLEKVYFDSGIESVQKLFLQIESDTVNYYFDEREFYPFGKKLLESGEYQSATAIFEIGHKLFPHSQGILVYLATSYYQAGDLDKSQRIHKKRMDLLAEAQLQRFLEKNKDGLATTAEDVLQRYVDATGGEETWRSIETMVVTFELNPSEGEPLEMVRMYKRPNLYRQGLKDGARFSTMVGNQGYTFNGEEWKEAQTFYRTTSIDNYSIDYELHGVSYEFVGIEVLNHIPVSHLIRTFSDGFTQNVYYSTESNLLVEIKSDYIQQYPFMESYISYWDYQQVEDVKMSMIFIRNVGNVGPPHGAVIKDVQFNVPLEDSLFMPIDQ